MHAKFAAALRVSYPSQKALRLQLHRLSPYSSFALCMLAVFTLMTMVDLNSEPPLQLTGVPVSSVISQPGADQAYFGVGTRFVLFNSWYGQFNNQVVALINAISIARDLDAVLVLPCEKLGKESIRDSRSIRMRRLFSMRELVGVYFNYSLLTSVVHAVRPSDFLASPDGRELLARRQVVVERKSASYYRFLLTGSPRKVVSDAVQVLGPNSTMPKLRSWCDFRASKALTHIQKLYRADRFVLLPAVFRHHDINCSADDPRWLSVRRYLRPRDEFVDAVDAFMRTLHRPVLAVHLRFFLNGDIGNFSPRSVVDMVYARFGEQVKQANTIFIAYTPSSTESADVLDLLRTEFHGIVVGGQSVSQHLAPHARNITQLPLHSVLMDMWVCVKSDMFLGRLGSSLSWNIVYWRKALADDYGLDKHIVQQPLWYALSNFTTTGATRPAETPSAPHLKMLSILRTSRAQLRYIRAAPRLLSNKPSDLVVSDTSLHEAEKVFGKRPAMAPQELLSIPLFSRPHFPKIIAPIVVHDQAACRAFLSMRDTGLRHVGLFLHKKAGREMLMDEAHSLRFNDSDQLHRVGVLAEVIRLANRQKGVELTFLCHHRIRWTSVIESDPLLRLATEPIVEPPADVSSELVKAYSLSVIETMKELLRLGSFYKEQLELLLESVDVNNPYHLADLGACLTTAEPSALQEVLEEADIVERLRLTLALLKKDLETTKVSRRINRQIEENVTKSQRKFFLNEQMKQIKRELGLERDEKEALISKFKARIEKKTLPDNVNKVINDELEKLGGLEPSSSEYNVSRNYLDWLTEVPWQEYSEDSLDIDNAHAVLDEMHYGLNDVKDRILEFIAVSSLRGNVQGKILLLSGPPGVGKTSIGKSVAKALNREFYRFSVGGMGDVAEIKGHRRTYIGAMPGKFVQALKTAKTANPVIMIDEIDKMGRGWTGDPASALLEALDPEQNSGFVDHYLDLPVDLSRCSSSALPTSLIQSPARFTTGCSPSRSAEAGLDGKNVVINDEALASLARDYCREAGVRNLKQHIEKIFRKVALEIARGQAKKCDGSSEVSEKEKPAAVDEKSAVVEAGIAIDVDSLEKYVGKKLFSKDRLYETTPAGISTGLAWTSMGGATLYIESILVNTETNGPTLKVTGQLGDVMKESSDIAFSYARNFIKRIDASNSFFEKAGIHMHVPEGATPKDGPSAGCTMVSSLLSLALQRPLVADLAMTGEITLTGMVLPVGGIREKCIAAKRSGVTDIVLPDGNRKDWDDLPKHVSDGLKPHFAVHYDDVYAACFEKTKTETLYIKNMSPYANVRSRTLSTADGDAYHRPFAARGASAPVQVPSRTVRVPAGRTVLGAHTQTRLAVHRRPRISSGGSSAHGRTHAHRRSSHRSSDWHPAHTLPAPVHGDLPTAHVLPVFGSRR
eukprot:IDg14903t1